MKTQEEIEDLKRNWADDPCWDIETTEGFEEHAYELKAYAIGMEKAWKIIADVRQAALVDKAKTLGCSVEVLKYLENLERRIGELEKAGEQ